MNNRIFQYIFILLLAFSVGANAQDRRTLDTKVADALAQMPANDLEHRDKVMAEIIDLGAEGFNKMSQLLTAPGVGDDTAVRFALNSLSRYASAFGREDARQVVENGLIEALKSHDDPEVKTFLMNQLNLAGQEKAVEAVKGYLIDKDLVEPAAQTLVAIGSPEAEKILVEALSSASDAEAITLVQAVGKFKSEAALGKITSLAGSSDSNMRKVALAAIAEIGHPDSYKLLQNAAKDVKFNYEPTHAAEAFIAYTDRLAEREEAKLAKKGLKTIIKDNQSDDKLHNQIAALKVYAKNYEYEAMPLLLKAIDNSNKEFRNAILNIAGNMGSAEVTRQWVNKAGSVPQETKAEIINMLGRRGDKRAAAFVIASLNEPDAFVREEAIAALVKLQEADAVPVLLNHIANGNDLEASKNALNQLLSQKHLTPVAEKMKQSSGAVKAALIDVIGAKAGNEYFNDILAATNSSNNEERTAAFKALKTISNSDNLDALIKLLLEAEEEKEISEVQEAIVAAAKGVESESTERGKLLQALKRTNKKERIVALLPEIGGEVALNTVTEYFNNSTGTLKETAFEALTSWKDYDAAASLYEVAESSQGEYRTKAFSNFVRMVRAANLPDDQKLLQYRKIMPFASGAKDEVLVINAVGNLKTFLSLVYLESFLDSKETQQAAARAIMKVAMPDADGLNGMSGQKVQELLRKVASVIAGEESDYDKININNYLAKMPKEEGYVSIFNGENLEGWQGLVGNPITRAKMSQQELAGKQEEANKKMHENWAVKDNTIVFNGKGINLATVKEYGDFEMVVDWRITKDGDSGIYLRGTPQVQIWDTARVEVGAQVGSGGLYNNKVHESKPLKVADNPIGDWNTFRIKMIGENVTVYLNGELVVDNVPLENYWDRSQPIFPKGAIELQAHGTDLAFRDIYVKEIKTEEIGLTEEEKAEGFVSLFNGMNLDGWQGNTTDYFAQNGELVVEPKRGGRGNLYTGKEYSDFIFRFEFQLTPGANNGLGIRTPLTGDAAYHGTELQILDNTAPIYANLKEYQYHGSVYGVIPAKRGYLKPVGEWNYQEVVVQGSKVKVILNGTVIVDGDIAEASKNGTLDGRDHPGLKNDSGYIGFLGHGSELKFRNIRIKDLSK
ncbi:MAG TPA: family 16 glycoside hydrolase [Mariniphaga sp.]|nr:family 16 glycoside hydrolase [Mariniphaga sp.]